MKEIMRGCPDNVFGYGKIITHTLPQVVSDTLEEPSSQAFKSGERTKKPRSKFKSSADQLDISNTIEPSEPVKKTHSKTVKAVADDSMKSDVPTKEKKTSG
jgi:hypothetical protein